MPTTVAVLGLGIMGEPMARNLLRGGYAVKVWNRTPARAEGLVREGAKRADTPAEASREARFTVVMVADPPALDAVLEGESGALTGLAAGSSLINMGTQRIDQIERLAAGLAPRGIDFIDAPVTGSKGGAIEGTLTILAGADAEALERARPILSKLGRTILHVGPPGDGTRAKLALNLIQSGMLAAWSEGLALGKGLGLPPATMMQVLENSAGNSGLFRFKGPFLLRRDFTTNFSLRLMDKDVKIAMAEAERLGAPLPVSRAVDEMFSEAMAGGMGEDDFLSLARVVEKRTGIKIES